MSAANRVAPARSQGIARIRAERQARCGGERRRPLVDRDDYRGGRAMEAERSTCGELDRGARRCECGRRRAPPQARTARRRRRPGAMARPANAGAGAEQAGYAGAIGRNGARPAARARGPAARSRPPPGRPPPATPTDKRRPKKGTMPPHMSGRRPASHRRHDPAGGRTHGANPQIHIPTSESSDCAGDLN